MRILSNFLRPYLELLWKFICLFIIFFFSKESSKYMQEIIVETDNSKIYVTELLIVKNSEIKRNQTTDKRLKSRLDCF